MTLNKRSINSGHDWAAEVNRRPPVLDLEPGLFTWDQPELIAASLLQSARRSRARKRSVYGSAMAMLCLYINRAGRKLPARRRSILTQAKTCLRELAGVHQNGGEPGLPTHQRR